MSLYAALFVTLFLAAQEVEYLPDLPTDHVAIGYPDREVHDAVARWLRADDVTSWRSKIRDADRTGVLAALLERLDVPVDSQALAFAKTSFQAEAIGPDNPRAIYFNDEVAVAYVRGSATIEIAAADPSIGPIFYTASLDDLGNGAFGIERRQVCLDCHLGPATSGVPGWFVGSVFPGPTGKPAREAAIITDHRTPLEERWGGWYVNARRGQPEDRSNAVASNPADPTRLDEVERNLTHLYGKFDLAGYLAPVSDIVALMTFEHQTQMLNYMTRAKWLERIAAHDGAWTSHERAELDDAIDRLVAYMIFEDEVPLPEPIEGVSRFTETFPLRGPRDAQGRSLRDFDLTTRLFRYPLSYMIYSASFDGLSADVKEKVYDRLFERLRETANGEAALEVLRDTKPSLPHRLGRRVEVK